MGLFVTKKSENKISGKWAVSSGQEKKINITVASWPGVGSTTLSLILSYMYSLKYFYSGAVFRYFSEKLGYSSEGKEYNRNEDKYGAYLDSLVDDYSKILLKQGGYIISTKPLGYIINKGDAFRIFLYADMESRIERSVKDGRESRETIEEGLKTRQKVAGDRFKRIYGFEWENMEVLRSSHECVLDTSDMSIQKEVEIVTGNIRKEYNLDPSQVFIFGQLAPGQIKDKAKKLVAENNLELSTKEAVKQIYLNFREEIDRKPGFIVDIFKGA